LYGAPVEQRGSGGGGDIDGISVKFSDFYAAKKVKKKNSTETVVQFQSALFKADFNKN